MSRTTSKLKCETLEDRMNPSSYLDGYGNLIVVGTNADDSVVVNYQSGSYSPYFYSPDRIRVVENGVQTGSYLAWNVTGRIYFYGYGGNDYFDNYANSWGVVAYGMDGHDTLVGYGQNDYLDGGANDDTLYGYSGNDYLIGGEGHDRMYGMDGNDYVIGGNGNDTVYGANGDDTMWGDAGNDYLDGGAGADYIHGGFGFDRYREEFNLSNPFYFGQRATDVVQQEAPTCQTLAVLAAASDIGHDFSRQLTFLGNNTWRVRVFPNGVATDVNVTFDGSWSDTDPSPVRDSNGRFVPEFWTILMQRARLATFGVTNNNEITSTSWNALNTLWSQRPQNSTDAIRTLTGRVATHTAIGSVTFEMLNQSLQRREIMTAYTPATNPAGSPLVAGHVYAIRDVYVDSPTNTRMVRLYNPWGFEQTITFDAFRLYFQGVEIG